MKESTIASSKTESDRSKKRYAKVHSIMFGRADNPNRLRTRMAYVQQSEEALAGKRTHCASFSIHLIVVAADSSRRQRSRRCISKCYGFTGRHINRSSRHF